MIKHRHETCWLQAVAIPGGKQLFQLVDVSEDGKYKAIELAEALEAGTIDKPELELRKRKWFNGEFLILVV